MSSTNSSSFNQITDSEFSQFQGLMRRQAGIYLSSAKKALVSGRLAKRLQHHRMASFGDYFQFISAGSNPSEAQIALDLLTTNETYFFREPKHFDFVRDRVLPARQQGTVFRAWSAACSSGEEPYSLAMLLADRLGSNPWELVASDISRRMLDRAVSGHYALERASRIPAAYLRTYCMKGVGKQEGTFLIEKRLRSRISFMQMNLNQTFPPLGEFDLVFLRNVMIYFQLETKRQVIARISQVLKPGGHLVVGHSESLNGVTDTLSPVAISIYRKP